MAITEVFPSPTVKQVIFQVKFQSLFYIENKIGDLQLAVMDRFPASKLIVHRGFLIGHVPVGQKLEQVLEDSQSTAVRKVWQFQTNDGVTLAISADSLSLTSDSHKTYNNKDSSHRFRDVIAFALSAFRTILSRAAA